MVNRNKNWLVDLNKAHSNISVNKRYVFFTSLATQSLPIYNTTLYNQGQSYVQEISQQLNPNIEDLESLNKVKSYIDLIGQLAEKEKENEISFVTNFKNIILQDKTGELRITFEKMINNIDTNFNYPEFIGLINDLLKKKNDIENERTKIVQNNMQLITQNLENLPEEIQKEYQELSEQNYHQFASKAQKTLLESIQSTINENDTLKFQTPINSIISQRINSALRHLVSSKTLHTTVQQAWESNNWNEEYIAKRLVAVVVSYVSSLSLNDLMSSDGKKLAQEIENKFSAIQEQLTDEYVENVTNLMVIRTRRTLEEVALTSRRNLAQMFLDLSKAERENVVKDYKDYGFNISINSKNIQTLSAKDKEKISKQLGEAIRKAAREKIKENLERGANESMKEFTKRISQLKYNKNIAGFFKERKLETNLKNCIKVKLNGPSYAEYLAINGVKEKIFSSAYIPGKTKQLKTDASATITLDSNIRLDFPNIADEITPSLDSFGRDFLNAYNKKGNSQIDIHAAEKSYNEIVENISKKVDKMVEEHNLSDEQKQKILNELNKFMTSFISVKDYTYGNNDLGFHGGSMGANSDITIENIERMYELGGITPIDKDLLYFAVLNCSEASLGYALKDSLATYILGAGAMMMFDDGFTASIQFLERVKENFGFAPKSLHLYFLENKYIPASYVYSTIYNNLLKVYEDLSTNYFNLTKGVSGQNKIKITNNISDNDIPTNYLTNHQSEYRFPQKRWDYIADLAQKNVTVEFIFMAGLLDIFEQIPQAFNI